MNRYYIIALVSGIVSAFSQMLLKKSSKIKYDSRIREYINPYVISGYCMVIICMGLMIVAYKGIPFKYGIVIESLVYIYVLVLGRIFLGEKITAKRVVGNVLIAIGAAVFSL